MVLVSSFSDGATRVSFDTHALATGASAHIRLACSICELLRFTLDSRYLLLRIPESRLRGLLFLVDTR